MAMSSGSSGSTKAVSESKGDDAGCCCLMILLGGGVFFFGLATLLYVIGRIFGWIV